MDAALYGGWGWGSKAAGLIIDPRSAVILYVHTQGSVCPIKAAPASERHRCGFVEDPPPDQKPRTDSLCGASVARAEYFITSPRLEDAVQAVDASQARRAALVTHFKGTDHQCRARR
ncbi:hypothetical protein AAFF_G00423230 [Aldrovandia affinis]|uniref:Uncharacterized protein n=1 Tax=Aldrovandia affinis TaxID=143900 RepID=A0AAD7T708_9TELE|nr:hypothetical protein AAFF_G00423230 [Aldrovandia affinis]